MTQQRELDDDEGPDDANGHRYFYFFLNSMFFNSQYILLISFLSFDNDNGRMRTTAQTI